MFYLLGIAIFFLVNHSIIITSNEMNQVKLANPSSFSNWKYPILKQRLQNTFLRIIIYSDYRAIKNHLFTLNNCAKEKIIHSYQEFLTSYYHNCEHYYCIKDTDMILIDNLVELIL